MYEVTISRKLAMALSVGFLVLLLGGCEQEGPAEQAGEVMDTAPAKQAGEVMDTAPAKQAGEAMDTAPAKQAGEAMDTAPEGASEAMEKAYEKMEETVE